VAKKIIFIAVMVVLLASLGVVLTVLNREEPKPSALSTFQDDSEYIIDVNGEDGQGLVSVTIKNSAGEFTVLEGDTPLVAGYEDYPIDTYALYRILNVSGRFLSFGLVTDEETALAPFGLENPRAEVRIKPVRGSEILLYIGAAAPDGYSVYVKTGGSPSIYLASLRDTEAYLQGIFDFMDKELSPTPVDDGAGGFLFDWIVFGGAVRQGEEVIAFIQENDEDDPLGQHRTTARIGGPINARLNMDKGYTMLRSIFGLNASRVAGIISGSSDLAKWGLDTPWSTVAASGAFEQGLDGFGLRVSKPDAAGKVYVLRDGVDLVYEADASQLPWLETSWFDLMDKVIIYPFIDLLSSVEVRTPNQTVSFSFSGEGENLTVNAQGLSVITANFRVYYQTLMMAKYDEISSEKPAPGAKPVLEIVYNYRADRPADTVSFYSTVSRRVLTSFNNGRFFYTFGAFVDKVIADLDQILAGRRVSPYL
jgi:hypothetical protein